MKFQEISIDKIDIAKENVRAGEDFGDEEDELLVSNIEKMDIFQPVVVRFDKPSKRYKVLIGRRRFLALKAKGARTVPASITDLKGAEAEAASLFENIIRKDLRPLNKAQMVTNLVNSTPGGLSGVSRKYGLPKSTLSEWLSLLRLPDKIQYKLQTGQITSQEGVRIARQDRSVQESLVDLEGSELKQKMSAIGVRRGAPEGLLTIRLVWDPRKKQDKFIWKRLQEKAAKSGLTVQGYARNIMAKEARR